MTIPTPPVPSPKPSWQIAPEQVPLSLGEVQVWRADLDVGAGTLLGLRQTLSADERARAERFHFPTDRDRYTAGRGILRDLLAHYLGTSAGDLRFSSNAHGKPALALGSETCDLRFNLSHSQNLALFAFVLGREVGVDLECVRPFRRDIHLAERFFSPQEFAALRALSESAQPQAFFECWTRKEAYIKARGGGLSINLASFTVSLDSDPVNNLPITGHDGPKAGRWTLRALAPGDGFVGAVAAEGADWSVTLWQWG